MTRFVDVDQNSLPAEISKERIEVFCRLHQLETWFRELVYVETKSRYGASWWAECEAALRRSRKQGIPPQRSMQRDSKHAHMATPENDPLWFISFDALLNILFDRKMWPLFAPYLTTKQLVRAKFSDPRSGIASHTVGPRTQTTSGALKMYCAILIKVSGDSARLATIASSFFQKGANAIR